METETLLQIKLFFLALSGAVSALLIYAGADTEIFAIFTTLLIIDFVTGVAKAHTIGERVTSNKAKYGITSKLSLVLIPLVVAVSAKAIGEDATTLFKWSINLLVISEAYSIIGNIFTIRTKKELPEWDVISLIGKKIRNILGGDK